MSPGTILAPSPWGPVEVRCLRRGSATKNCRLHVQIYRFWHKTNIWSPNFRHPRCLVTLNEIWFGAHLWLEACPLPPSPLEPRLVKTVTLRVYDRHHDSWSLLTCCSLGPNLSATDAACGVLASLPARLSPGPTCRITVKANLKTNSLTSPERGRDFLPWPLCPPRRWCWAFAGEGSWPPWDLPWRATGAETVRSQPPRQPGKLKRSYDPQQTWPPPRLRLLTSTKWRQNDVSRQACCGHVCRGRSASQSTAPNVSAVMTGRKKSREYLM